MKLLIRGGSIAAGCGVKRGYADILQAHYAPLGLEVINRSYARHTSFDGIETFDVDIDPFRPELLMLHFGIDDAFCPVYRSEFKENLVQMVRLARGRFNPIILLPTAQPFENPYDMEAVSIYYRTIREVAVDLDCEMIPVHTFWTGYLMDTDTDHRALVQEDPRCPNERGHAVMAEAVIAKLEHVRAKKMLGDPF